MSDTKPDLERATFAGAIAAAVISLLPYLNIFLVTAYVIGALVAVWFAVKKQEQTLTYTDGAKLGFWSVFFGVTAAAAIFDLIWQIAGYQLWQKQNAAMMLAIFRLFASASTVDTMSVMMSQNAEKPFAWYIFLVQVIGGAVFAAIFSMPTGLLGVKIFQRKRA